MRQFSILGNGGMHRGIKPGKHHDKPKVKETKPKKKGRKEGKNV